MHQHFRSHKRQLANMDETIRMASNMQRSIASGRSSYVEMRAVSRIVAHNMKTRINSMRSTMNDHRSMDLLSISSLISCAYEFTLTPNGKIRQNELEDLISIDLDISVLLATMEDQIEIDNRAYIDDDMAFLKDLLNRRQKLVQQFKA